MTNQTFIPTARNNQALPHAPLQNDNYDAAAVAHLERMSEDERQAFRTLIVEISRKIEAQASLTIQCLCVNDELGADHHARMCIDFARELQTIRKARGGIKTG